MHTGPKARSVQTRRTQPRVGKLRFWHEPVNCPHLALQSTFPVTASTAVWYSPETTERLFICQSHLSHPVLHGRVVISGCKLDMIIFWFLLFAATFRTGASDITHNARRRSQTTLLLSRELRISVTLLQWSGSWYDARWTQCWLPFCNWPCVKLGWVLRHISRSIGDDSEQTWRWSNHCTVWQPGRANCLISVGPISIHRLSRPKMAVQYLRSHTHTCNVWPVPSGRAPSTGVYLCVWGLVSKPLAIGQRN